MPLRILDSWWICCHVAPVKMECKEGSNSCSVIITNGTRYYVTLLYFDIYVYIWLYNTHCLHVHNHIQTLDQLVLHQLTYRCIKTMRWYDRMWYDMTWHDTTCRNMSTVYYLYLYCVVQCDNSILWPFNNTEWLYSEVLPELPSLFWLPWPSHPAPIGLQDIASKPGDDTLEIVIVRHSDHRTGPPLNWATGPLGHWGTGPLGHWATGLEGTLLCGCMACTRAWLGHETWKQCSGGAAGQTQDKKQLCWEMPEVAQLVAWGFHWTLRFQKLQEYLNISTPTTPHHSPLRITDNIRPSARLRRKVVFMVPLSPRPWDGLNFNWGLAFTKQQNKKAG